MLTGTARVSPADNPSSPTADADALSHISMLFIHLRTHTHHPPRHHGGFQCRRRPLCSRVSRNSLHSRSRKRESWARIAQLIDETMPERTAALADAIVSAVGAEYADRLGEHAFFHLATSFCLPPVCRSALLPRVPYRDLCHPNSTRTSCEKRSFWSYFGIGLDPCVPLRPIRLSVTS